MIKFIPNALTLANLAAGSMGMAFAHVGSYRLAVFMLLAALVFDFLDGFLARLLHAKSPLGAQLDSLADMVSFGLFPAFLLHDFFALAAHDHEYAGLFTIGGVNAWSIPIFVYVLAVALRLANFNVSHDQGHSFKGLPSPAAAMFLVGFPALYSLGIHFNPFEHPWVDSYATSVEAMLAAVVLVSALMLVPIPLLSLKFQGMSFSVNRFRYFLIILSLPVIFFLGFLALQALVVLYLLLSIIHLSIKS
jgi:CDP-diacylglycerol--serine O-phosphatidyltransferase